MKRTLLFPGSRSLVLLVAGTAFVAATYGLVRLAYGLFLPDLQHDVGLGTAAAGYVSSGASVSYCAGAAVGLLADRRPVLVLVLATTTGSVGAAGMALSPGLATFAATTVLASSAAGLASPGLVALVARAVRADRRAGAQAVVNSGTGPGLVAAGLLALAVLPQWRAGFAVSAAVTLLSGAAVVLLGLRTAAGERDAPAPSEPPRSEAPSAAGASLLRRLRAPVVGALGLGVASAVVWTYGRSHLGEQGLGPTASTAAWMAIGVGGTATVLTARRVAALSPPRGWTLTLATLAVSLVALVALGSVDGGAVGLAVALVSCAVFGWAFVAATSVLIAWAADLRPEAAAGTSAAFFVLLVLGQALGSAAAGGLAGTVGLGAALGAAAALAAASALLGARRVERRAPGP